jgi:predicted AlkP superfamily phosphohydrolase/phosphomutase
MTIDTAKPLLVIGIDGFDPHLLHTWSDDLPNLSELAEQGISLSSRSTVPPDSIPAWATICTGLDPSQHGLLGSLDYWRGGVDGQVKELVPNVLQGKTFWDWASKAGKKVCILNPFLAYPAWPVNGAMISGPSLTRGETSCFPRSLTEDYDVPRLGGFEDYPTRVELDVILDHCLQETKSLIRLTCQLLRDLQWDLFYTFFVTVDRIEHFFWRFGDPEDPLFPGPNRFQNVIKEFYVLMDRAVGDFRSNIDSDVAIMVISDHGHRLRSTKLVNFNEFLRQKGMLVPRGKLRSQSLERMRSFAVTTAQKLKAERFLYRFGKFFPKAKEIRKSGLSIDFEHSMATLSDFAGSTSFGGICLNQTAIRRAGQDTQVIKQTVMDLLDSLTDPVNNVKIVKEIYPRENVYHGMFADKFPDILFVLRDEYGVHWSIYDKPIVPDYAHRMVSGGHRREGVFILFGHGRSPSKQTADLVDITPTILDALGVRVELATSGQSLLPK